VLLGHKEWHSYEFTSDRFCAEVWLEMRLDGVVSIVTGYGLDIQGVVPDRHSGNVQTDCGGPTQPPIQRVVWVASLELKQPGQKPGCCSPSSAEAKNEWICASTLPYAFMACTVHYFTCG
jgi:hypothetical protein